MTTAGPPGSDPGALPSSSLRGCVRLSSHRGLGSRSYRRRDQTYDSAAVPAHQAIVMTRLSPIFVPVSRPRSVSLTGVKGSYSANQRMPAGSELVGTKPLPRNGRRIRNIGELLAVSTLLG